MDMSGIHNKTCSLALNLHLLSLLTALIPKHLGSTQGHTVSGHHLEGDSIGTAFK